MFPKLKETGSHSWDVVCGNLVVAHIYYFDKCEVQDPDEPPFEPFYSIGYNKHIEGKTGNVTGTLYQAFDEVKKELEA